MLIARVRITASSEGVDQLVNLLSAEADRIRSTSAGCQLFVVSIDTADSHTVMIAEEWASKEDFEAYTSSDQFASVMGAVAPLLAGPPDSAYYLGERVGP